MRMAFALFASLAAAGLSTPSAAQVISVSQVLVTCPDFAMAQACPPMATQFLEGRNPGPRRNGQVVDLVLAIAQVAQHESVPRKVCLNAADGLRVLASGVTDVDQVNQILDIADALCLGNRTAAIHGPGLVESVGTSSIVGGSNAGGGNSGGGNGQVVQENLREEQVTEPEEQETASEGGLGSNDAANSPNENALEHANEHATDNEHGQNGEEHGQSGGTQDQSGGTSQGGGSQGNGPPEGKGKDKDK